MNSSKKSHQSDPKSKSCLTCQELESFVIDYLDHNLEPAQHEAFVQHLGICPGCDVYLENYKKTILLTQTALDAEGKASCDKMPETLVKAILAATSK